MTPWKSYTLCLLGAHEWGDWFAPAGMFFDRMRQFAICKNCGHVIGREVEITPGGIPVSDLPTMWDAAFEKPDNS